MTTLSKSTTPTPSAASDEVDARARKLIAAEPSLEYGQAVKRALDADSGLKQAYAQLPAVATTPAVPVTTADEREIFDWILRSVRDGHPGALPGALGQLGIEADSFKKLGMPIAEAARRAMDGNPHLLAMAKLLLADIRRNAPDKPVPADEAAQTPGDVLHNRAQALVDAAPHLDYHEAVVAVLAADPALKVAYAGS